MMNNQIKEKTTLKIMSFSLELRGTFYGSSFDYPFINTNTYPS